MRPDFNPQPYLANAIITAQPLLETDRECLFKLASDPLVWAGHPAKARHERAVFDPYFDMLLASATTLAIRDQPNNQVVGCSRYYEAPDHRNSIAIGYTFLGRDWWGGPTNFEMKTLMFGHAFKVVNEIWLHIDPTNIRSQRATAKLGAEHVYDSDLNAPNSDRILQCWRITQSRWDETKARHSQKVYR